MKIQNQAKFYISLLLLTSPLCARVVELTSEQQYEDIIKSGNPAVVKFSAKWCGACQSVKDAYEQVAQDPKLQNVTFVEVEVDNFQPLAQKNGVVGIPTFLYVQNGSVKHQDVGVKNPATFKDDIAGNINTQFNTNASVDAQHDAAAHPAATGHEMGILAKLQAFFMSAVHAVRNMFMDVIHWIKGLFGK